MFNWLKKKKTNVSNELIEKASRYAEENTQVVKPVQKPPVSSAEDVPVITVKEKAVDYGTRYSRKDKYDGSFIRSTLINMDPATSPSRVLSALESHTDISFVDKMLELIEERGLRDSEVYRSAQVDRRLFSKIVSDRYYKPSKDTCIALALALHLSLKDAEGLIARAGYTLSHSDKRDVLIEFFFKEKVYDLNTINAVLYQLNLKPFGRQN